MLAQERRSKIKELLLAQKSVEVKKLVSKFGVSEETIRRDLSYLENEGIVKKIYGGAILVDKLVNSRKKIPPVEKRLSQNFNEKMSIGKTASNLIKDKQNVIIDSGTTTYCILKNLEDIKQITFITNGINIAKACSKIEDSSVFLIGEKLIKKSMSLVGPQAMRELEKYNANLVFLGTTGISLEKGFTSSDIYEAEVKRSMVKAGDKAVVVADHTKFKKQGLVSFADFKQVDMIITDNLTDKSILDKIKDYDIEIITTKIDEFDFNF
ncbi:MAG: DeoR/GlpR family DNA-binding transcription regulator [Halanaerobiales bacterium]